MKKEIIPMPVFMAAAAMSFFILFAVFYFSPLKGREGIEPYPAQQTSKTAYYMTDKIYQVTFPINVNSAIKEELMEIPGIGEATAQKILDFRQSKGGKLHSLEQLLEIEGIGEKKLEKLKEYLTC